MLPHTNTFGTQIKLQFSRTTIKEEHQSRRQFKGTKKIDRMSDKKSLTLDADPTILENNLRFVKVTMVSLTQLVSIMHAFFPSFPLGWIRGRVQQYFRTTHGTTGIQGGSTHSRILCQRIPGAIGQKALHQHLPLWWHTGTNEYHRKQTHRDLTVGWAALI